MIDEQYVETEIGPEQVDDGRIPCAHCGTLFTPSRKFRKYHSTRCKKEAAREKDKGRKRTGTSSAGKAKVTRSLWLVRKEAEIIGYILQYVIARRTGLVLRPPTAERREHLAHVIKKLEAQPPFSYIQQFLYRLFPVFDPEAKPGRSAFGDAAQYAWGWYETNPELEAAFGDMVPPMFRPGGAQEAAQQAASSASPMPDGAEYREPVSYEDYMRAQGAPEVDTMAAYRGPEQEQAND